MGSSTKQRSLGKEMPLPLVASLVMNTAVGKGVDISRKFTATAAGSGWSRLEWLKCCMLSDYDYHCFTIRNSLHISHWRGNYREAPGSQKRVSESAIRILCSSQFVQTLNYIPAFSLDQWAALPPLLGCWLPYGSSTQERPRQYGTITCRSFASRNQSHSF